MLKAILTSLFCTLTYIVYPQNRWEIKDSSEICWQIKTNLPHADHIEMSGRKISAILQYEVLADSSFRLNRTLVWPMLRTLPNLTSSSLIRLLNDNILDNININGKIYENEKVKCIILNGFMIVKSTVNSSIECTRLLFTSPQHPIFFEKYTLKNNSLKAITIEIPDYNKTFVTDSSQGQYGSYTITLSSQNSGTFTLSSGDSLQFCIVIKATKDTEKLSAIDIEAEQQLRSDLLDEWQQNLILETPSQVLNTAFAFAKIRAAESIFETKGGFMHSPGGCSYYAAIWANDQAEYIAPFFPFLGYNLGNEASVNAYMHFARFMNDAYNPIPSSIIAEGDGIWNGRGDRGDQAMIAYGASRFALASGNEQTAEKLWPLIEWCLEYLNRKITNNGVVASDCDELELRFPAGDANLSTSALYYDALLSAVYLGNVLHKSNKLMVLYAQRAKNIRQSIEQHFGYSIDGFNTYRYYEGNTVLRAWICMPLIVDIFDRKEGTIAALFSDKLWTADGLATEAGKPTFWDRSTLYALRGVFAAGDKERALKYLEYYSNRRLLGEHVPYAIEAYPEGNQRHLSAESGLYCRIFTEGLFGIRPVGLQSFTIKPQLPDEWNYMRLRNIRAFNTSFNIDVKRNKSKVDVLVTVNGKVISEKTISNGTSITVSF